MFDITENPIDVQALIRRTTTEEDGGVAVFLGTVRRHSQGKNVVWLEYEAYPAMAIQSFQKIGEEVRARWGMEHLSILHRTGRLVVGDIAVVVVAAAPHRKEAFAACQYAIDRLKAISPVWKKELTEDGCVWVDCPAGAEACHV